MGDARVQAHVHDTAVMVTHRDANRRLKFSRFRLFYKRHARLSPNRRLDMKGDFLVMRVASRNYLSVVNMRRSDAELADFILQSLAEKLRAFQGPKRRILRTQALIMPGTWA
ncbi:hypothetical protein B0H10DRAFT_2245296 [Mycena sp. CBHHK59/15]|nr:hypothetical protein B0H10DRAFT_2245296 [Mycena sp. CBHHK59/15]